MSRGGTRGGCGRKPLGADKRVRVTITMSPEATKKLRELNARGVKAIKLLGRVADDFINNYEE